MEVLLSFEVNTVKVTVRIIITLILIRAGISAVLAATPPQPTTHLTFCHPAQLELSLNDDNGEFVGMSQNGTYIQVHNLSAQDCRIAGRPIIHFLDARHHPLPAMAVDDQPETGPGPVILPQILQAHTTRVSTLRWTDADVFEETRCINPVYLSINVGGEIPVVMTTRFKGRLCSARGQSPVYNLSPFQAHITSSGT
ncbi:DUF4232 domain-containing protein [Salmonella enterica subsp. enterica]|nr:DUF4232 domain-containing protein [Salmonella enterica subsp. enterica serovar Everleigh]ECD5051567.1 DUF4232 domain-containing protein [Salmonella enterica subsp. enterica serovar Everleigh]ECE2104443.1 DUF4232 domain-containing protein [Salmonella enterica]